MDTTRHPNRSARTAFPAENRADSPAVTPSSARGSHASVTVGRSDSVVQPSTALQYEADPSGHRVVARYTDGTIAFAFGGFGHRAGQFDTPLHVVAVSPAFAGEPAVDNELFVTPWVAVADYGNHRIQFFECDGAWLGETELEADQPPCHLTWRTPVLEVTTVEGRTVRVHVAAALLTASVRREAPERPVHTDPRRVWRVC